MDLIDQILQSPAALRAIQAERLLMEITELICEVMEREGIDQAELAARLGKKRPYVTRLLDGSTKMTIQTIADVFAAMGRSVRVADRPLSVFSPRLLVTQVPGEPDPVADGASQPTNLPVVAADIEANFTQG